METIYLVEDAPAVRERLLELLGGLPDTRVVGIAADAEGAIADILEGHPDAVVLDLHLAHGSGFDVLRAVHAAAPDIDVYILTNFAAEPTRRMAARLGARGLFDKSTEFARVREVLAARAPQPEDSRRLS